MSAERFEGIKIHTLQRTATTPLPNRIRELYQESLEFDFPHLTAGQKERMLEWMLSGKSLHNKQTRKDSKILLASRNSQLIGSVAVANVTSGKLGMFGGLERAVKSARGKTWRQLGMVARSAYARTLDPVDATSTDFGITDVLAYGAITGAEPLRVSIYPYSRRLGNGGIEGETWLATRAASRWGLEDTGEEPQQHSIFSTDGGFIIDQMRAVSQTEKFMPSEVVVTHGADILFNIQRLQEARNILQHVVPE